MISGVKRSMTAFPTSAECQSTSTAVTPVTPETFSLSRHDRLQARFAACITAAVALVAVTVAGCSSDPGGTGDALATGGSMFSGIGYKDLSAKYSPSNGPYGSTTGNPHSVAQIYPGRDGTGAAMAEAQAADTASAASQAASSGAVRDGDGYQLNFDNADASAVCKTILGDILQQNYVIDPRVTGQITLSSARPVAKANLVRALETALKSVGGAIVREGSLLRVVPVQDSLGSGPIEVGTASEGYGTTVITPKYVSVATVARLLENFATRPGAIKADPTANMILVQGTAPERRAAIEAASTIDNELMRSQSVGIFPLANSSPDSIITELNKILDTGEGGVGQKQVLFQAMSRMNAVLVVARTKPVLDTVTRWINRLDRSDPASVGVKVYRLKFAQAKTVAAMLNDILAGRGSATGQRDQDALQSSANATANFIQSPSTSQNGTPSASPTGTPMARTGGTTTGGIVDPVAPQPPGPGNAQGDQTPSSSAPGSGQGTLSNVRITADVVNNSLLIIANATDYKIVEAAIRQLDRAPVQVAIEATIAEITLTDQLQYGVQAYLSNKDLGAGTHNNATFNLTQSVTSAAISATVPGANLILGPQTSPRVVLNALHAMTAVKVLSSPSMVVLDNQSAALQVGDQVAIKTQSSQSTENLAAPIINNITYKDTGIILKVMPHVHADGIVNLDVEQEISNVVGNTGGADGLTPTISQRRVKSSIVVASGQTVLLAGMISESSDQSRSGLPGLTSWKWIGDILSSNQGTSSRNELIIFIKPKIMRDQQDAQAVSEEFRDRMTKMLSQETDRKPVVVKY